MKGKVKGKGRVKGKAPEAVPPMPLLIVGNGPTADTPEVAEAMAAAPVVMRLNAFGAGRYIGTRCDIWGTSLQLGWGVFPGKREEVTIWWSGWPWSPAYEAMWPGANHARVVADQDAPYDIVAPAELLAELHGLMRPKAASTGLIMAALAIARGYEVTVAGFTHFAGARMHHFDDLDARHADQWHDGEKERAWVDAHCKRIGGGGAR